MRLHHIYNTLKEKQENLTLGRVQVGSNSQDTYQLTNIQPMLQSFKAIESLDIFKSIEDFKDRYNILYSWADDIYSSTTGNTLNILNGLKAIRVEVNTITNILEKLIPQEEDYVISVKLPEYESLSDLPNFYKDLDIMFTSLINCFGDDTLTIHSFENGSKWNDFSVKNKDTITIIFAFLTTSMALSTGISQIQREKLEMEKINIEIQQIKETESEGIFDKLYEAREEKEYNKRVDKFIEVLKEEHIEITSRGRSEEEIKTVIKRSFKSYQVLLSDGTEFYGQLNSNDEDLNKWVEQLGTSQKLLINQKELEFLSEGSIKSLIQSTHEETGASIDTDDNEN